MKKVRARTQTGKELQGKYGKRKAANWLVLVSHSGTFQAYLLSEGVVGWACLYQSAIKKLLKYMQAGVQTDEGKSSAEDCYFQVCQVDNQDQPP